MFYYSLNIRNLVNNPYTNNVIGSNAVNYQERLAVTAATAIAASLLCEDVALLFLCEDVMVLSSVTVWMLTRLSLLDFSIFELRR